MPSPSVKKILVTGCCGFIGSNFVRHLYKKHPSYQIFNFDLLTYAGHSENLKDIEKREYKNVFENRRYHFIQGDISNKTQLDSLFSKHSFHLVFNFAAETHVDRSIVSMNDFLHTNINGVWALAEAVREHNVPRFIHISTDEVYGSIDTGYANEESPLKPSNPYSASKAAGDLILQAFIRTHTMPAVIIRGSNNYGPYQYPEKLIPLAISNIIEKKKIPIHGSGLHVRSWLHVDDFCEAIDLVGHEGKIGHTYNVSGEERTNMEVLSFVADHLNVRLKPRLSYVADRPGQDTRYAVDATKISRELDWKPRYSFEKSMGEVIEWYIAAKPWWEALKTRTEYIEHYERQSNGRWY